MNLFELVLKQMRQRALSTWLTMLSVTLGVALAVAIMLVQRGGRALFGQTDYGYDVLVGAKGSPLQLVLNTTYHLDRSPGNIPHALYEQLDRPRHPQVRLAVPFAVGDTYKGQRIVGTTLKLFGIADNGQPMERPFEYRPGRRFKVADGQGRLFHPAKFEAVIGADIPRLTGLKLGDKFQASHGMPSPGQAEDVHAEQWEVVGILEPTRTANDRVIFIPLISFYTIEEHEDALEAQAAVKAGIDPSRIGTGTRPATTQARGGNHDDHEHATERASYFLLPDGTIELKLPKDKWMISAILVKSRSAFGAQNLMWTINNRDEAAAVNPATVMREFFNVFLAPSAMLLSGIAFLVTVVAAVGILVSIYNSVSARKREIAILRALGATRVRILSLICAEAALVGLIGGVLGIITGHLIGAGGSVFLRRMVGEGIDWLVTSPAEWIYLGVVVVLAILAGLVPALKAYRTPVATNLVAA
jgi:putative ABC transport system permease protein